MLSRFRRLACYFLHLESLQGEVSFVVIEGYMILVYEFNCKFKFKIVKDVNRTYFFKINC